jgi:glycosyltransferase involved in cell wall biosynthesis
MSVYNGEKYLRYAINSIINQSFSDFEFIIINDASTDNTGKILGEYNDNRIVIINNEKNLGLTKSLNKGIAVAKGKYIARMDADDISMPERIEKQVGFMENHKDVAILGTDYYPIDEAGRRINAKLMRPISSTEIKRNLFKFNPFIHSSLMIRREVLKEVGYYDERFKKAQDYELCLRILSKYEGYNLPEELIAFRIDKTKLSIKRAREQIYFAILARLKTLKQGLYPPKYFIYVAKDFLRYIFPYYSFYFGKFKISKLI